MAKQTKWAVFGAILFFRHRELGVGLDFRHFLLQPFSELATDGKVVIYRFSLYLPRAIGLDKILLGEIEMGSQLRVGNFVQRTECWRLRVSLLV